MNDQENCLIAVGREIYLKAVGKPKTTRKRFVRTVCGPCDDLRHHVDSLLTTHGAFSGNCGGQTVAIVLDRHQR